MVSQRVLHILLKEIGLEPAEYIDLALLAVGSL